MNDVNPVTGQSRSPAHRALRLLAQERWAILPESLLLIRDIASREHVPDFEAVLAKRGTLLEQGARTVIRGKTAIVPVTGPIFRRANLFTELSGATSIDVLAREFKEAEERSNISSIIVNFDTPGGMVNGVSEFSQMLRASRKPVIGYVGNMAASAGYWMASACATVVINDTAQLGSIGVVTSFWLDDDEELVEIVSTQSPNKRVDVRTDEGRAHIQRDTDELAQVFIDTVAANRGVSAETVMNDFGRGGILIGKNAVKTGMADRIGSLESLISDLNR
jgi:ClpP class serine protease